MERKTHEEFLISAAEPWCVYFFFLSCEIGQAPTAHLCRYPQLIPIIDDDSAGHAISEHVAHMHVHICMYNLDRRSIRHTPRNVKPSLLAYLHRMRKLPAFFAATLRLGSPEKLQVLLDPPTLPLRGGISARI